MRPIRVLVVDHSAVVRKVTVETLGVDPAVDVVGTAGTGPLALSRAAATLPDVVILDGDLSGGPSGGDAVDVARALRAEHPDVVVLFVAVATPQGAASALRALDAGAADIVSAVDRSAGPVEMQRHLLAQVLPRIKTLARPQARRGAPPVRPPAPRTVPPPAPTPAPATATALSPELVGVLVASGVRLAPEPPAPRPPRPDRPYTLLVIAASTGGPEALSTLFRSLAVPLGIPVVVVQHMPPMFTTLLAARLDGVSGPSGLRVAEATDGAPVVPGQALLAPGDHHLEVHREGARLVARLTQGPRENFVRPAADVLFRSAAQACGPGVLAVVLTGMGRDGQAGARAICDAGGTVVVQDLASSVVWGMPGSVAEAGLADDVLPISGIGAAITARVLQRT